MSSLPMDAASPNWAEISTEPQCPLCEYMLRGLNVARCPECGFKFEWDEVLDASKREHPYLFEHHPERNFWSYFRTVFGAMRPRRFWSKLHPAQPGSAPRLVRYWLLGLCFFAMTLVCVPIVANIIVILVQSYGSSGSYYGSQPVWQQIVDSFARAFFRYRFWAPISLVVFVVGLWPWLTYLVLQIFSVSMRKAKVRPVHVLRCVIYGLDLGFVALMCGISFALSMTVYVLRNSFHYRLIRNEEWIGVAGLILIILLHTDRLAVAYRRYLRFDHPRSVAISAQFITGLTMITAYCLIAFR